MSELKDPKLNKDEVESLAALNASLEEIAAFHNTTEEVIEEFYKDIVRKGRLKGKIKARQLMMDLAEKDKDRVAIEYLARQFLGDGGNR